LAYIINPHKYSFSIASILTISAITIVFYKNIYHWFNKDIDKQHSFNTLKGFFIEYQKDESRNINDLIDKWKIQLEISPQTDYYKIISQAQVLGLLKLRPDLIKQYFEGKQFNWKVYQNLISNFNSDRIKNDELTQIQKIIVFDTIFEICDANGESTKKAAFILSLTGDETIINNKVKNTNTYKRIRSIEKYAKRPDWECAFNLFQSINLTKACDEIKKRI
jgi:hypothetical protein